MRYPLMSPEALRQEPPLEEPEEQETNPDAWPNWMLESLCPWEKKIPNDRSKD